MLGKQPETQLLSNMRFIVVVLAGLVISCSGENKVAQPQLSKAELELAQANGKKLVKKSFGALSGELKAQIASKGLDSAIYACQLKANPIIDSVSTAEGVEIKRIAKRTRNTENKPSKEEKHLIKLMERAQSTNEKLSPFTFLIDSNTIAYYHPILIQPMCLNCHGEPGVSMREETYETILNAYPMDKAIGYKLNDLRGLWAIKFDKNKLK